jgi:hypothetical protein
MHDILDDYSRSQKVYYHLVPYFPSFPVRDLEAAHGFEEVAEKPIDITPLVQVKKVKAVSSNYMRFDTHRKTFVS